MPRLELDKAELARARAAQPDWFRYIALKDDEGRQWVQNYYQPERLGMLAEISRALGLLRGRQVETSGQILGRLDEPLRHMSASCRSIVHVMERAYYPVLAYYNYCRDDFDGAEACLDLAGNALREAILLRRFLLPIADSFLDFGFQRARIARSRRLWNEMYHQLEIVRAMLEDREPFCVLRDGTKIGLTALRKFYESITLDEDARLSVSYILDDELRLDIFSSVASEICCRIDLVIPYP